VRLAAECLLVGLHADFVGIADANRGARSITNDAERVVSSSPPSGSFPTSGCSTGTRWAAGTSSSTTAGASPASATSAATPSWMPSTGPEVPRGRTREQAPEDTRRGC
jgi:hypothetical protein